MKILLHMGREKTGTTALQTALWRARGRLAARGVLYPDGREGRENHRLLTCLFKPDEQIIPDVKRIFDGDLRRMRAGADRLWSEIRRRVDREKPKLLILSSEYFPVFPDPAHFARLRELLGALSGDIQPVLYFRESAAHYASTAQQWVKNGRPLIRFDGGFLERETPLIEAAFGREIIALSAERERLIGGDIVRDFVERCVRPVAGEVAVDPVRMNESVSAEVMAILDRYRRRRYPRGAPLMRDHHCLRRILARLEPPEIAPKARLRPEFADAVRRAATDLVWLRDRHDLVFSGVDYGAIDGAPVAIDWSRAAVEDIFLVDPERRDALEAAAMAEALGAWRLHARLSRVAGVGRALNALGPLKERMEMGRSATERG